MSLHLFKELPLAFFRPLSGRLAPVYWAVLQTLYSLDFEGEPLEITQDTAIEQAALLLEQNQDFLARPDEFTKEVEEEFSTDSKGLSPATTTAEPDLAETERLARCVARKLLKRLEHCGWFDYEYREAKKGYILNFRDYSARVLHTLLQIANQEQPVFEGLAHNIKTALNQHEIEEKPGVAIYNAQKATKDLVREIKILSRNIHRYAERALKAAHTSKALLELQLDIYQKKIVDSSYHRFKTTDNIFKYRTFIIEQLNQLEAKPELLASATQWIAKNNAVSYSDADAKLEEWLLVIRSQMATIHLLTDDLDRKNARYTATTLQKISYLLNQEHDLEGRLVSLLKTTTTLDDNTAWAFDPGLPCFYVQTIDQDSLYVKPKERSPLQPSAVPVPLIDEEQKAVILKRARQTMEARYSRARVYALARLILKIRGQISLDKFPLYTNNDFVNLIYLCTHGQDHRAPFELCLSEDWKSNPLKIGRFTIRPGELRWKFNKEGSNN